MSPPRPKIPGFTLAALASLIFAVILVVALTARSVPPPTVSELAPQAAKQITQFDSNLGGGTTGAEGSRGVGGNSTGANSSSASPPTPRVHKCIGSPPRQIEDPQSPPCVAYWKGDNGGATWKGATRDQITVAIANYYLSTSDPTSDPGGIGKANFDRYVSDYEQFFNNRFEFYGRRLHLVTFKPVPPGAAGEEMQGDAVKVDQELHAFAATQYSEQDGRQYVYFDKLAKEQIMGVVTGSGGMSRTDEQHLASNAPYEWDYTPSVDKMLEGYGEFICNVLAGKPPVYAAPPQAQASKRTFGIIVNTEYHDTPPVDVKPLQQAMSRCGETPVIVQWGAESPGADANAIIALQQKHVTDVMYTGQTGELSVHFMPEATAEGFHPEWLISDLGNQDVDGAAQYFPKDQAPHVLGLQVWNKTLRPEDMPYMWAIKEVDPTASAAGDSFDHLYKSLLLLASGIQMAGRTLTPTTFQQGLMRAEFPNPGADGPPSYQARVGFPGIHSMQQTMTMVWLGTSERSPTTGVAPAYCYVMLGRRFPPGSWPNGNFSFFKGPCR